MIRWSSKVAVYGGIAITKGEWYAMVARLLATPDVQIYYPSQEGTHANQIRGASVLKRLVVKMPMLVTM
jgi:hypothetical protein